MFGWFIWPDDMMSARGLVHVITSAIVIHTYTVSDSIYRTIHRLTERLREYNSLASMSFLLR